MHATYFFLMDGLDAGGNEMALAAQAREEFTFMFGSRLDEDNGYDEELLLFPDGRCLNLLKTAGRDTESTAEGSFLSLPQSKRWSEAIRTAWLTAADELDVPLPGNAFTRSTAAGVTVQDVEESIWTAVPREIASSLMHLASGNWLSGKNPALPDEKLVRRLARYALILDSDAAPFALGGTPYQWRSFDLRRKNVGREIDLHEVALLLVDIHT